MNGGDLIARVLERHGVRFLFTLCGGHISPILVGAKRRGIRVVDVRHEATAVFAADAVARLTGVPGVAAVTAGPGVTNTITAVKNAQLAQSPLVRPRRRHGHDAQGPRLAAGHRPAGAGSRHTSSGPPRSSRFATWRRRSSGRSTGRREGVPGPVFVECPVDLLYDEDAGARTLRCEGERRGRLEESRRTGSRGLSEAAPRTDFSAASAAAP